LSNAPPTQDHSTEHHHRAKERQYWTWQTLIGISAAIISLLAVGITAAGFYVLLQTLKATREAVAEAHRQAEAAEAQTMIANDALVASTRPWIEFDEAKAVSLTVRRDSIFIWVDFKYRNVGHSPAESVLVHPSVVIGDSFGNLARAVCEEIRSTPKGGIEGIVFPDKPGAGRVGIGIMMRDIIADRQKRGRDYNEMLKQVPPGWSPLDKPDSTVDLWISGCIGYKFHGFSDIHTTGFSLSIKVIDPSDATGHKFKLIDTDHLVTLKGREILLEQNPLGSFAD
jgi:hypothetical protein